MYFKKTFKAYIQIKSSLTFFSFKSELFEFKDKKAFDEGIAELEKTLSESTSSGRGINLTDRNGRKTYFGGDIMKNSIVKLIKL